MFSFSIYYNNIKAYIRVRANPIHMFIDFLNGFILHTKFLSRSGIMWWNDDW